MNERNDFKRLVDHHFSALRWDDRRRQSVLDAIDEKRKPIRMKKKISTIFAFAAAVCLMAGIALAASLAYSQRYTEAERADALLAKSYGITENLRSMFTRTNDGDVYLYESLSDLRGMPGDYTVNLSTKEVKWSFDGPNGEGWDAEKLNEILEHCKTPDGYSQVCLEAQAAAQALGMSAHDVTPPTREEMDAAVALSESKIAKAEALAVITMDEAKELALNAIQSRYGLTAEQISKMEYVEESSMFYMEGDTPCAEPYFFLTQEPGVYTEQDGIYIVDVNAIDGTIEDILYDSGLFGNG